MVMKTMCMTLSESHRVNSVEDLIIHIGSYSMQLHGYDTWTTSLVEGDEDANVYMFLLL